MKNSSERTGRGLPLATVFLAAMYPVLALYAYNAREAEIGQLAMAATLSALFALTVWAFFRLILKRTASAGLATLIILLLFWNYGLIYSWLSGFTCLKHWHLLPLLLTAAAHVVWVLGKIRDPQVLRQLYLVFIIPLFLLIAFNLSLILPVEIRKYRLHEAEPAKPSLLPTGTNMAGKPDIYLIVLDEYASLRTIREEWGYDNHTLSQFLRDRGYFVAENSQTRYNQTIWSIASLLDLEYVTGPVKQSSLLDFQTDSDMFRNDSNAKSHSMPDFNMVMNRLNHNRTAEILKKAGYRILVLEGVSQHQSSFRMQSADTVFTYQSVTRNERDALFSNPFYLTLYKKTLLGPLDLFMEWNRSSHINYVGTRKILEFLKSGFQKERSPKFVYAHILCPHGPHVFDRNGNPIEPIVPDKQREGGKVVAKNTVNAAYLEQYLYISNELRAIAEAHYQHDPGAIVIILSDHGPRPFEVYLKNPHHSFRVFNAVFFPNRDYLELNDSIAPVNLMRIMMNNYFGGSFQRLEDR